MNNFFLKRNWKSFFIRIILPVILVIALFILSVFTIILPALDNNIMDRKKEMISELTNSARSILSNYEKGKIDSTLTQSKASFVKKKAISISGAPKPIGPYSQGIMVNGMLFVSGQIPVNPYTGEILKGDIQKQTKQVMTNILAILKEAGMNFSNVVKASIFLSDMNNFQKVNEVYASYFNEDPPARECIQAVRLPKNVDIEISVIAVK